MTTPLWTHRELTAWASHPGPAAGKTLAFYRGDWNAITTDPNWMTVPADDHLVHRGDGVFETLLCEAGAVYNLQAHLHRLRISAAAIHLEVPWSDSDLRDRICDTFRASERERALARVLVGRGPGGFSVDPAESRGPSLYIAVYEAPPPFMQTHPEGARLITSTVPPKSGGLAQVKTCNYLPNALAKREASMQDAHFAVGVDADGYVTESATENLAVLRDRDTLQIPPALHHLAGTTLARVAGLWKDQGGRILEEPLRPQELFEVQEVWIVGTTAYVTQAVSLDRQPLPTGPAAAEWEQRLMRDILTCAEVRCALQV